MKSKKSKWIIIAVLVFGLGYIGRQFLPFMFFNADYIEIEFNVPETVRPKIGGSYRSWSCQDYSVGTGNWIAAKAHYRAKLEQISPTQYRTRIYLYDNSPCGWSLYHFGWQLIYNEPEKLDSRVDYAGGAVSTFNIVREKKHYSDGKYIEGDALLHREYIALFFDPENSDLETMKGHNPKIYLNDHRVKEIFERDLYNNYDYNPYNGKANKITLIATIDESTLYHQDAQVDKTTGPGADEKQRD